ncbi:MAG: sigma-54-dependent Fis family transcriptional regulator [Planctomycetes bacterium]|nr:sigma-54-dependent Fis family transcriptional regulator [Planctomycetota bacterium]
MNSIIDIKELVQYTKNLTVLYVEDEDDIRTEFADLLRDLFHTVETAKNGKEGLECYKANRHDIIICDIKMPVMNGIEMAMNIRRINRNQPIIITSAHSDAEYLLKLISAGIQNYLLKPIDHNLFLEIVFNLSREIIRERELVRYKANLEALYKSIKDAIIVVDKKCAVIAANNAAKEICGVSFETDMGTPIVSQLSYFDKNTIEALIQSIINGIPIELSHIACQRKNHLPQIISLSSYPLKDASGALSGGVIVIKDETRLTILEQEIHERKKYCNIIGKSNALQKIYSLIETLSQVQSTILICGESGTGKELVAEALHYSDKGKNKEKPFITVNCAALPDELLESELFGHVKGAFTGATQDRIGRFQMADGGTIFLDEIGDISAKMQLRLLRFLQEKEFERVGEAFPVKVNTRVIAATNQDLQKKVRLGQFREDLYYRLKVIELNIPPLRDRREDIPLLTDHFLTMFNRIQKKNITSLSSEVLKIFMAYDWPGNVRELKNILECAHVLCSQSIITADDLPEGFFLVNNFRHSAAAKNNPDDERTKIVHALEKTDWNKAKAARLLGIDRKTLYMKIVKYNITENRTP